MQGMYAENVVFLALEASIFRGKTSRFFAFA